jgi:hypothetical protein
MVWFNKSKLRDYGPQADKPVNEQSLFSLRFIALDPCAVPRLRLPQVPDVVTVTPESVIDWRAATVFSPFLTLWPSRNDCKL